MKHALPRTLKEEHLLEPTIAMDGNKKHRTDLVEDDPFARSVRPVSHAKARDDGNWRAQTGPRVVQVQFSPFSRGFTQAFRPAPVLHTGSFWHFSKTEISDLAISLAAFSLGLSFMFHGGLLGGMMSMGTIKSDGTLWAWGYNTTGELGLNNKTNYSSPVQIPGRTY